MRVCVFFFHGTTNCDLTANLGGFATVWFSLFQKYGIICALNILKQLISISFEFLSNVISPNMKLGAWEIAKCFCCCFLFFNFFLFFSVRLAYRNIIKNPILVGRSKHLKNFRVVS